MQKQRGFVWAPILIILGLLVAGGLAGWGLHMYQEGGLSISSPSPTQQEASSTPTQAVQNVPPQAVSTQTQNISVPGMSQYTDSDFGFSFWYPSGWQLQVQSATHSWEEKTDENVVKTFTLDDPYSVGDYPLYVYEVFSPNRSIFDGGTGKTPDETYFFDLATHTWMMGPIPNYVGVMQATSTANVSFNTMGGLHMFYGGGWPEADSIIPLSAEDFVIFSANDDRKMYCMARTVVATDPTIASVASMADQVNTIKTELNAYSTPTSLFNILMPCEPIASPPTIIGG